MASICGLLDAQEEVSRPIHDILSANFQLWFIRFPPQAVAVLYVIFRADESLWVNQLLHVAVITNRLEAELCRVILISFIPVQIENHGSISDGHLQKIFIDQFSAHIVELLLVALGEMRRYRCLLEVNIFDLGDVVKEWLDVEPLNCN